MTRNYGVDKEKTDKSISTDIQNEVLTLYVTRFGKIRINAATNYFCFFLLTGCTGPEDLDFQV